MNQWNTILTASEIEAQFAATAKLDARFAAESKRFWSSRTVNQLKALAAQAWNSNDADGYQLARSFLGVAA